MRLCIPAHRWSDCTQCIMGVEVLLLFIFHPFFLFSLVVQDRFKTCFYFIDSQLLLEKILQTKPYKIIFVLFEYILEFQILERVNQILNSEVIKTLTGHYQIFQISTSTANIVIQPIAKQLPQSNKTGSTSFKSDVALLVCSLVILLKRQ